MVIMAGVILDGDKPLPVDPIELIAIDLDGTMLRSDGSIGAKTIEAVGEAGRRGIKVVIATARPPRSVLKYYEKLRLDTWQINHNGALIYDQLKSKPVAHKPIDAAIARQAVETARRLAPQIPIGVEVVNTLYTDDGHGDSDASYAGVTTATGSLEEALSRPVSKVLMLGEPDELSHIQSKLHQQFHGRISFATSHLKLLQIVCGGVDKGVALAGLAKHYGVSQRGVMAVGDAPNDLGMLKWSGLSVAVQNAWPDVRRAAHFVVGPNNDDGVADAIGKYAF